MKQLFKEKDPIFSICTTINEAPSKDDIEETLQLLQDFGINIQRRNIPSTKTLYDLHLWRKNKIREYLYQ